MRIVQAVVAALVINAVLFVAAAQLVRERPRRQDITVPTTVSLVTLPRKEVRPEEPEVKEPEPPRDEPRVEFSPELPAPSLTAPDLSGPTVALDPRLFGFAAPVGNLVFEAGDLDRPPRAIVNRPPVYPLRAQHRGQEGTVKVRFLVGLDGTVSQVSVLESEPPGVFDQAVIDAVSRWRFEPGVLAGKTVAAWIVKPITFDLRGSR